jgi:hypothetical protein
MSGLRFRLGVEAQRLGLAYEYDPYFSLSISRVDPLPHQVEAVYDFKLPLPRIRFLLADDAGAGRTIMAGLLLRELKLRGLVARTLIVAAANLCFQWQREMYDRFRERFDILRGVDLKFAYGTNPWLDKGQLITSIDCAKRDEVEDSLSRVAWDLVIVDEAHRMSASDAEHKTERYKFGELLGDHTDHLVFSPPPPTRGIPGTSPFSSSSSTATSTPTSAVSRRRCSAAAPASICDARRRPWSPSPTPRPARCASSSPSARRARPLSTWAR